MIGLTKFKVLGTVSTNITAIPFQHDANSSPSSCHHTPPQTALRCLPQAVQPPVKLGIFPRMGAVAELKYLASKTFVSCQHQGYKFVSTVEDNRKHK